MKHANTAPPSAQNAASAERPAKKDGQAKHGHAKVSHYVPALDGLRAFAVIAVIVYHMKLGWAPGGLMGVTVFFVISGYLINGLLVAERERTGTISLTGFWMRRIRRLFPAIFLCVVGTAALCTLFDHVLLDKMRPDIAPSLLFFNNWWQIFRDVSYFEAAGSPSPLMHFWSLSIEEQFYLVWPLLLLLMYRIGMKKKVMAGVVLVLAVLSAVEMAVLYNPTGDPSRVYYGTDTRAMSLLVGVWLAFAWPSSAFGKGAKTREFGTGARVGLSLAGIASFAGLVAIVALTNGYSSFSYYGGIALVSVLSAVLIATLVVPRTAMSWFFSLPPLVWVGKRSYGMYLWHFPILLLTTDPNSTSAVPWWMRLVQVALIIVVSALSFTFIEDPIRKGKLGEWRKRRREERELAAGSESTRVSTAPIASRLRVGVPAFCFAGLLVVACVGVFAVQPTDYASQLAGAMGQGSHASPSSGAGSGESASPESGDGAAPPEEKKTMESIFKQQPLAPDGHAVFEPLLVGDSVSAGAEDAFYEFFPFGHIDAVVSRNIWESPYEDYLNANQVGDYVVICLGTNNAVEDWQIDEDLLAPIDPNKKVFMVNTRNVRDWMQGTNESIARTPQRHPNVTVIDWYGASEGHDEYFAGDGTHLTQEGAHAYIQLIYDTIAASL